MFLRKTLTLGLTLMGIGLPLALGGAAVRASSPAAFAQQVATATTSGRTCQVAQGGGADFTTIQAAVNDDTCRLIQIGNATGVHREHSIVITRAVEIAGTSTTQTQIDGEFLGRVFDIKAGAQVLIRNLRISRGNLGGTSERGMAISNAGNLMLRDCTIDNNAGFNSAAFYNSGAMSVTRCRIDNNSSFTGPIINTGSLTITQSAIVNNGGAATAIQHFGTTLLLVNSTVAANMPSAIQGDVSTIAPRGAVWISSGSALILNSTIVNARNPDQLPGDLSNRAILQDNGASVVIRNSIVAADPVNAVPGVPNCSGTIVASGVNISTDASCSASIVANPRLGAYGIVGNDGYHALLAGSPAIDAGETAACTSAGNIDQRGITRPQGALCDLGAIEVRPNEAPPSTITPTPTPATPPFVTLPAVVYEDLGGGNVASLASEIISVYRGAGQVDANGQPIKGTFLVSGTTTADNGVQFTISTQIDRVVVCHIAKPGYQHVLLVSAQVFPAEYCRESEVPTTDFGQFEFIVRSLSQPTATPLPGRTLRVDLTERLGDGVIQPFPGGLIEVYEWTGQFDQTGAAIRGSFVISGFTAADGVVTFTALPVPVTSLYYVCSIPSPGYGNIINPYGTVSPGTMCTGASDTASFRVARLATSTPTPTPTRVAPRGTSTVTVEVRTTAYDPLAGWLVTAENLTDGSTLTRSTNSSGDATLVLRAGRWKICETLQPGWSNTYPGQSCYWQTLDPNVRPRLTFLNALGAGATPTPTPTSAATSTPAVPTPTPPAGSASIRIVVVAQPVSIQAFNFTGSGSIGAFWLSDSALGTPSRDFSVSPGSYRVAQAVPADWTLNSISCDDDTTGDVDSGSIAIQVAAGQTITCTFVNQRNVELWADVWNDLNADGRLSLNEPMLAGWKLELFRDGQLVDTRVSDSSPRFNVNFGAVEPGGYRICQVAPSGWTNSHPNIFDERGSACFWQTLPPGVSVALGFGNFRTGTASLNTVYTAPRIKPRPDVASPNAGYTNVRRMFLPVVNR